jgi:hypothetical protein
MYPYYRVAAGLTDDDIAGLREIYGDRQTSLTPGASPAEPPKPPANPPVTPPSTPPSTPSTPTVPSARGSGQASGSSDWSASVPLLVGNNTVTIRAYDVAGNSAWRTVTVVRR